MKLMITNSLLEDYFKYGSSNRNSLIDCLENILDHLVNSDAIKIRLFDDRMTLDHWFNGLFGPCIFTIVNMKQRPTTLTLSQGTSAHALCVSVCFSSIDKHGIQILI